MAIGVSVYIHKYTPGLGRPRHCYGRLALPALQPGKNTSTLNPYALSHHPHAESSMVVHASGSPVSQVREPQGPVRNDLKKQGEELLRNATKVDFRPPNAHT